MAKRTLHPKMAQRAEAVKAAHAHLAKTVPGFRQMAPADRFKRVQDHVRKQGC